MSEKRLAVAFVGDALSTAGFALAGIPTHEAISGRCEEAFALARSQAQVVLLDARCARHAAPSVLEKAIEEIAPVTMIAPRDGVNVAADIVERARRLLGSGT